MIITLAQLDIIPVRHWDERTIYCSGCFDLTHFGHALFFEACKKHGDLLVVGVADDHALEVYKRKPVLPEQMRIGMVNALRAVDYAFLTTLTSRDRPLEGLDEILKKLKPDVYAIAAEYDVRDIAEREAIARECDVNEIALIPKEQFPWFPDLSTSGIIQKIKSTIR